MKLIDMGKVLNELCLSHKDIIYIDKNETAERIRKIPSIDIDRPQGEWIEMYRNGFGNMICMCSKCSFHASRSRYCPNCGMRMKGEGDDI